MLWAASMERGFTAPLWMTFRQAKELGAHVRKGETGTLVVYADTITKTEENERGEEETRSIPFMKGYTVFNVEQIEGLPAHYHATRTTFRNDEERDSRAETFFARTGATIRHGGNAAFYAPEPDVVQMPEFVSFRDAASYYATLAHECVHWTRHERRLAREFGRKRWGDEGYAMEELVAEMGAAFLCADLELTPRVREDHAPYIAGWLKVLKGDRRAIFTAASHAQRAADYLHRLQDEATGDAREAA
jgi:antirestriction protein ArdC